MKIISTPELKNMLLSRKITILDIRDEESYRKSHINTAIHLDFYQSEEICSRLDKDKMMVVYCYHGVSSKHAAEILENLGFMEVYSLEGGYSQWQNER